MRENTTPARRASIKTRAPKIMLSVFREVLENAIDAIGMSTPQGRHYYQNKAFTNLFGLIGENPPATLYCDEKIGIEVFQTIMGGGMWTGEVAMYAKDRRILNIHLNACAIKDERGVVIGLVGIHTHASERRLAEAAPERSEFTYREIFNSINDTIWIHDLDTFQFKDVNSHVTEMFGYSIEEALSLSVGEISSGIPPFTPETAATLMKKARAGEPQLFEWQTRHKDGHLFWTEVNLKRGTIAGRDCLLAIERDITERKRTEEKLHQMHAIESLGMVAGGIAHDFNNLLSGIFGNIELAKAKLVQDHSAIASLQIAHQALKDARQLTNRLLTFAQGGNPILETFELGKRIREIVQFHLSGSNVAPCFDIPMDLWPVTADKGQITEVIANLTINAKEAMTAGGTLYVHARNISTIPEAAAHNSAADCVKLTFRDEGIGIPEKIIGKIFTPYFTTKKTGSGLGLAIVHGIIKRHKGHIDVESAPGAGTTFTVCIPADTRKQMPTETVRSPMRTAPIFTAKRVLIMDDDKMIRETMSSMLEVLGCTVDAAVNSKDAIDKYAAAMSRESPFDLTILDLTVPGETGGKEAIGEILALDPDAKVIVSSGYSSDPVLANYSSYGFFGRLVKPFTFQDLRETLANVFRTAQPPPGNG